MSNHTIHNIVHGNLYNLLNNNEDILRQVLNADLRKNANNIPKFFSTLVTNFKRFDIQTELENIEEWASFSKISEKAISKYYIITFPPFTNKTEEFFQLLLANSLTAQFLVLDENVREKEYVVDRTYYLYQTLSVIEPLIKDLASKDFHTDNELYVKDLVNASLFVFYFEVMKYHPECSEFETLTSHEVLHIIDPEFSKKQQIQSSIINLLSQYLEASSKPKEVVKEQDEPTTNKSSFVVRKEDFRAGYTGKFDYDSIDKKAIFENIEQYLFEKEYIDSHYNFTNKHTKKKNLAIIYRILILKGFFKKRNFKNQTRDFDPSDYRQYLDNRYNVNTAQEFSRITETAAKEFKSKDYFLDRL